MFVKQYAYLKDALPGISIGIVSRYKEISLCLWSDCDSWVLKAEKILIHLAFILGFASPSRLLWQMIRELLTGVSQYSISYLDDHPDWEGNIRMAVSLLEYIGMAHVWDHVRDASLCMRYHNCDGDFFGQLNNIKIHHCSVKDPLDDQRKLSTCERMLNDSPLILLAGGMFILAMVSDSKLEIPKPKKPEEARKLPPTPIKKDDPTSPKASGKKTPPAKKTPGTTTSSKKTPPPEKTSPPENTQPPEETTPPEETLPVDKNPPQGGQPPAAPSLFPRAPGHFYNPQDPGTDPPKARKSSNPKPCPSKDNQKIPLSEPNSKTQVIHGKCPGCRQEFYKTVDRPLKMCCHKVSKLQGMGKEKRNYSKEKIAADSVVKKLFKEVKCTHCQEKVKRHIIRNAPKAKPSTKK